MKITVINTSDTVGGAAVACKRLFDAIKESGTDIKMLVQEKKTTDEKIVSINDTNYKKRISFLRFAAEYLYFLKVEKAAGATNAFSPARLGADISKHKLVQESDIIHLHWINNSFISINGLKKLFALKKKFVWHLQDMWAFTGGCHYSGECKNYKNSCGNCPYLRWSNANDLSARMWKEKTQLFKDADITVVASSKWLADTAKQSSLFKKFRVLHIPCPIDTEIFKPLDKKEARKSLGLDTEKEYILFGAMNLADTRKGFKYFRDSLEILHQNHPVPDTIELLMFGKPNEEMMKTIQFKINNLGFIKDIGQLINIYNASSLFVIPSLEDNLPNTILESFACGTPVVGFNAGGIPEMIDHLQNGYVAEFLSSADIAKGITWVLNHPEGLAQKARNKAVEKYSNDIVASHYNSLFQEVVQNK